jgi:hypothetical protein
MLRGIAAFQITRRGFAALPIASADLEIVSAHQSGLMHPDMCAWWLDNALVWVVIKIDAMRRNLAPVTQPCKCPLPDYWTGYGRLPASGT